MANETPESKSPAEEQTPQVAGTPPAYQAVESADHFNVEDRRRRLRIGLLALIAVLLVATTAGYAYLYQIDQQIITKLNDAPAATTPHKATNTATGTAAKTAVVRSNPKLAATLNPQVLTIKEWGVSLILPSETIFSKPSYAILPKTATSGESVGFSNGNLAKYGGNCVATGAPLGMLARLKSGTFPTGGSSINYVATISGYDYGFVTPQSTCDKAPADANATSVAGLHEVIGALNTLSPSN